MTLGITGPDQNSLAPGMVLCDPSQPIPVSAKFKARVVVFNIDVPITKGIVVTNLFNEIMKTSSLKCSCFIFINFSSLNLVNI